MGEVEFLVSTLRNVTELKRSELELLKLKKAIDTSGEAIFLTNRNGLITYVNPEFTKLYGFTTDEVVGKATPRILKSGLPRPHKTTEEFWQAILSKQVFKGEVINKTKDGRILNIELSVNPVLDEQGNIFAFLAIERDVTKRKETELTIQKQLSFAHALNQIAEIIATQNNPEIILERVNSIVGKSLAVDRSLIYDISLEDGQAIGLCEWLNQDVPDVSPTKATYQLDLFKGGSDYMLKNHRFLVSHKNDTNEHFIVDQSGILLHENMKIQSLLWYPFDFRSKNYFVLVFNQVTGLREWRQDELEFVGSVTYQLTLAFQKIRMLAERDHAQLLQNAVYQISQVADDAETFDDLYKSVHEIVCTVMHAKNFYIALHDDKNDFISFPYFVDEADVPSPPAKVGKGLTEFVLRTGKPLFCDEATDQRLRESGEVELVGEPSAIWLGVPLKVADKTIGVMSVQHYSEPKAYSERELHMLEYVSSQVAKTIVRKQTERKIIEEKEKAEEANRLKTYFLSTMSHEIRTPLNAILGHNTIIKEQFYDESDEETKVSFEGIEEGGNRLLRSMTQIFDISRIDARDFQVDIKPIALDYLVSTIYRDLKTLAEKKILKVVFEQSVSQMIVLGDEYCLRGAISNVLHNAIEFSSRGTINIVLEKNELYGICSIADEGIGISDNYLKHLFLTFSQEDLGHTRKHDGLGLGLALTKKYIELINGKIEIRSKKEVGTIVTLKIPLFKNK